MASTNNKKKWLALSVVGIALVLIPRRSSQKAHKPVPENYDPIEKAKSTDSE
ncbi:MULTISPECIES: hypothetical protein [Psychrobacter]|uniref:hypothetical protein n=1 Tax=Psychrobacter TaxID=497 RepID=UPI000354E5ED|nr:MULTISPECIES: hypothetical protein [unclassified Psychrobacter]AGP49604.1 hypothetical protein PSYCG_10620 [Psychrobacter sp. G]WAI87121.1 hypothetical protein SC65A3_00572 [Psychrobacter sp. SC65A.3]|tara:strand:+ start:274 stop:429 length:156 start_codon:yes stop_codon:yes gene_type:complete